MKCSNALEGLLTANPAVLARCTGDAGARPLVGADAELLAHVRACAHCAAIARTLRAQHEALVSVHGAVRSRRPAEQVAAAAFAAEDAREPARHGALRVAGAGVHERSWARIAAVALFAVGAAATVLVGIHGRDQAANDATATADPTSGRPSMMAVEVPAGHNAVVFQTRNPNISVVWFY
jgi:hypothetical protein